MSTESQMSWQIQYFAGIDCEIHLNSGKGVEALLEAIPSVSDKESRSTWAKATRRFGAPPGFAQVHGLNPLVCPRCHSERSAVAVRIVAVITEPQEVCKILRHLVKIGRSPPGFDPASLN